MSEEPEPYLDTDLDTNSGEPQETPDSIGNDTDTEADNEPTQNDPDPQPEPEPEPPPAPLPSVKNYSMRAKLERDLEFAQKQIERLDRQYERSLLISGGQVSDKSRIEMPSIMHIDNNLRYWKGEETRLMSLLDPECASRAHVPLGFLR